MTPIVLLFMLFPTSHSPIQSNALPQHIKISVSRDTIFEDSFAQVLTVFGHGPGVAVSLVSYVPPSLSPSLLFLFGHRPGVAVSLVSYV